MLTSHILPLFTLILLFFATGNAETIIPDSGHDFFDQSATVNSLQWHKRLILVNPEADEHNEHILQFQNEFNTDIKARKVLVLRQVNPGTFLDISGNTTEVRHFTGHFTVSSGQALLIGLDGEVKASTTLTTAKLADLLWRIDTMPMRQQELRQN